MPCSSRPSPQTTNSAAICSLSVTSISRPRYSCGSLSALWTNGRHGTLLVSHGKTAAARRVLPFTPRVRAVLEARWEAQGRPIEGWVWPSGTQSGHIQSCTPQEAASEGSETKRGASACPVLAATHLPDPSRGEWLRCLDAGADCWTFQRGYLCPLCPPLRGCCLGGGRAAGWAQF